jgi:hypothetical protein
MDQCKCYGTASFLSSTGKWCGSGSNKLLLSYVYSDILYFKFIFYYHVKVILLFFVRHHCSCSLLHCTVNGVRGKVWFDSLNIKYASKLSCYASSEAYLSHLTSKMTNALFNFLSDKYSPGEASVDNFEAYLSFCESNHTLPRAPFTVHGEKLFWIFICTCKDIRLKRLDSLLCT